MTKEEILAMEAGEKLDGLVAEVVFDKTVDWQDYPVTRESGNLIEVNPYSTDISAAWQVAEFMDRHLHLHLALRLICPRGYIVSFVRRINEGGSEEMGAVVAGAHQWLTSESELHQIPEAICKAALLARLEVKNG